MSDIQDWLDERARIHGKATEGPWEAEGLEGNITTPTQGTIIEVFSWAESDAQAIVDAHNSLPKALSAIRNVRNFCIAAHLPVGNYGEYGQGYNKALSEVMSALQEAIIDEFGLTVEERIDEPGKRGINPVQRIVGKWEKQ